MLLFTLLMFLLTFDDNATQLVRKRITKLKIIEAEFATVYADRTEIKFSEAGNISCPSRASLCVDIYQRYRRKYLGYVLRKPNYSATAVFPRKVSFARFKAPPKTIHVMFCGLSQMVFTHYYDTVDDIYIFKGVYKNTMYVLRENSALDPESLYLDAEVYGVDVNNYVDLKDK